MSPPAACPEYSSVGDCITNYTVPSLDACCSYLTLQTGHRWPNVLRDIYEAWVIYCFLAILFETLGGEAAIANHVKDGGCPPVRFLWLKVPRLFVLTRCWCVFCCTAPAELVLGHVLHRSAVVIAYFFPQILPCRNPAICATQAALCGRPATATGS